MCKRMYIIEANYEHSFAESAFRNEQVITFVILNKTL